MTGQAGRHERLAWPSGETMKITRVTATALRIPVDFSELGVDRIETTSMCYAEV